MENKNIIERHTTEKGFNLANALLEQENIIKAQMDKILALEEAIAFFANWYNRTQESNILVPEHLAKENNNKLIL